jgi:hypothetical protein
VGVWLKTTSRPVRPDGDEASLLSGGYSAGLENWQLDLYCDE